MVGLDSFVADIVRESLSELFHRSSFKRFENSKIFQSQQDVKRALQSIPISDTRFYFRLQRAFERVIRFETSEYHIALIESSYQYST